MNANLDEGAYDEHGNYIPPPDNSVYRTGKTKMYLNKLYRSPNR
jgi:hypothetical protein